MKIRIIVKAADLKTLGSRVRPGRSVNRKDRGRKVKAKLGSDPDHEHDNKYWTNIGV